MTFEYCKVCDSETGNAGIHDGSLYLDNGEGPFCQECFNEFRVEELLDQKKNLEEKLRRCEVFYCFLGNVLDAYDLLPNDLKSELQQEKLGWLLEKKLQETDLVYNIEVEDNSENLCSCENSIELSRVILVVQSFCRECEEQDDPGACSDCKLHEIIG